MTLPPRPWASDPGEVTGEGPQGGEGLSAFTLGGPVPSRARLQHLSGPGSLVGWPGVAWPQGLQVGHRQAGAAPSLFSSPWAPHSLPAGAPCPLGAVGCRGTAAPPRPACPLPCSQGLPTVGAVSRALRAAGAHVKGQAALRAQTSPVRGPTRTLSEGISLPFSLVLPTPPRGSPLSVQAWPELSVCPGALSWPGSLCGHCRAVASVPEAAGCGPSLGRFGGHPHWHHSPSDPEVGLRECAGPGVGGRPLSPIQSQKGALAPSGAASVPWGDSW